MLCRAWDARPGSRDERGWVGAALPVGLGAQSWLLPPSTSGPGRELGSPSIRILAGNVGGCPAASAGPPHSSPHACLSHTSRAISSHLSLWTALVHYSFLTPYFCLYPLRPLAAPPVSPLPSPCCLVSVPRGHSLSPPAHSSLPSGSLSLHLSKSQSQCFRFQQSHALCWFHLWSPHNTTHPVPLGIGWKMGLRKGVPASPYLLSSWTGPSQETPRRWPCH